MYIVALTGGIGSGKSEASKQFAQLGVPVVDTDIIAHELTAAQSPILAEITDIFGVEMLNTDGTLNRGKLRAHILNDPAERLKLEALMHPAIYDHAVTMLNENEHKLHPCYQLLVVPLLFENNRYLALADKTLVIDCNENLQVERAMSRSQLSAEEVKALIDVQTTRENRLNLADEIIENNTSIADLANKVNEIHKKFIKTCIVSK